VRDICVMLGDTSPARKEIEAVLDLLYDNKYLPIEKRFRPAEDGLIASIYEGMKDLSNFDGDLIVAYSDIYWDEEMLTQLLSANNSDITILVDQAWRDHHYPDYRIWHDELCAELIFGSNDSIEASGEIINIFDLGEKAKWYESHDRVSPFKVMFSHTDCRGEIIGLVKFTRKGRDAFVNMYNDLSDNNGAIPLPVSWTKYAPDLTFCLSQPIPLRDVLLGCFLSHLFQHSNVDITVDIIPAKSDLIWHEIDHWGDWCMTEGKLEPAT